MSFGAVERFRWSVVGGARNDDAHMMMHGMMSMCRIRRRCVNRRGSNAVRRDDEVRVCLSPVRAGAFSPGIAGTGTVYGDMMVLCSRAGERRAQSIAGARGGVARMLAPWVAHSAPAVCRTAYLGFRH